MAERLRKRIFWRLDDVDDWIMDRSWSNRTMDAGLTLTEWLQRAACAVLGHRPIAECGDPAHDRCAFCPASMAGRAARRATA